MLSAIYLSPPFGDNSGEHGGKDEGQRAEEIEPHTSERDHINVFVVGDTFEEEQSCFGWAACKAECSDWDISTCEADCDGDTVRDCDEQDMPEIRRTTAVKLSLVFRESFIVLFPFLYPYFSKRNLIVEEAFNKIRRHPQYRTCYGAGP